MQRIRIRINLILHRFENNKTYKLKTAVYRYDYEYKEMMIYTMILHTYQSALQIILSDNLVETTNHGYDTRINHNIHLLKPKHEYAKKCIQNNIPLLVNNIPNNILEKIHTQFARFFYICETLFHSII